MRTFPCASQRFLRGARGSLADLLKSQKGGDSFRLQAAQVRKSFLFGTCPKVRRENRRTFPGKGSLRFLRGARGSLADLLKSQKGRDSFRLQAAQVRKSFLFGTCSKVRKDSRRPSLKNRQLPAPSSPGRPCLGSRRATRAGRACLPKLSGLGAPPRPQCFQCFQGFQRALGERLILAAVCRPLARSGQRDPPQHSEPRSSPLPIVRRAGEH